MGNRLAEANQTREIAPTSFVETLVDAFGTAEFRRAR
jgi:hypothetical protein